MRRVSPDDSRLAREKAALDRLEAEWAELRDERDARAAEWDPLAAATIEIEGWLRDLPRRVVLKDFEGAEPKLQKGEMPFAAAARLEAEAHHLRNAITEIHSLPISADEAKAQVRAMVEEMADTCRPDCSGLIAGNGAESIRWAKDRAEIFGHTSDQKNINGFVPTVDVLALCCWLNPTAVADRLAAEIDELDDGSGVTSEARKEALEQAEADLLAAERAWVFWIDHLEAHGKFGYRRRGISPLAVLGLEIEERK